MHEYAVTRSLVDRVLDAAAGSRAARVRAVRVRLGRQSGIVQGSVDFYFEQMTLGTPAAGARLEFVNVDLRLRCPRCGSEFDSVDDLCGCNAGAEVLDGQGITLESIDVE